MAVELKVVLEDEGARTPPPLLTEPVLPVRPVPIPSAPAPGPELRPNALLDAAFGLAPEPVQPGKPAFVPLVPPSPADAFAPGRVLPVAIQGPTPVPVAIVGGLPVQTPAPGASGTSGLRPERGGPAFDPRVLALERIDRERQAQRIQAEYENVKEGPGQALSVEPSLAQQFGPLLQRIGLGNLGTLAGAGQAAGGAVPVAAGALAGLAGPVAIAVAAVKAYTVAWQTATEAVRGLGNVAAAVASNDTLGALNAYQDTVLGTIEKIPILGEAATVGARALQQLTNTVTQVTRAFVQRGAELEQYSPTIALGRARAEIREIRADIREADQLGPGLARLTDAQSRLAGEFRELLLPIKKFVVEVLAGFLETIADAVIGVRVVVAAQDATLKGLRDAVAVFFERGAAEAAKVLAELPRRIGEAVEAARKKDEPDVSFLGEIDALARQAEQMPFWNADQAADAARQVLAVPLFGGF